MRRGDSCLVVDADVDGEAELVTQDDVSGDVTTHFGRRQRRVRLHGDDALVSQLHRQHHRLASSHRLQTQTSDFARGAALW